MNVGVEPFDEAPDATHQARERADVPAWWRTGLTALAVSFGVGRLLADVGNGTGWPSEAIGSGFAVLVVAFVA